MFQEIRPFGTTLQEITGPDTISIVTQPTELDDFYVSRNKTFWYNPSGNYWS
nr:MAG TPA: hypothetical protein [Microviridae sp.]